MGSQSLVCSPTPLKLVIIPNIRDQYELVRLVKAHDEYILKCKISPDVRYMQHNISIHCSNLSRVLATASSDKTVKLWNLDTMTLEKTLHGHQRWVWDCDFSADSSYLVTGTHSSIYIF